MSTESGMVLVPHELLQRVRDDLNNWYVNRDGVHAAEIICELDDALAAAPASPPTPAVDEERKRNDAARGLTHVTCAVRADGWLFIKHAAGQWVSAAQLQPFSMSILRNAGSIK